MPVVVAAVAAVSAEWRVVACHALEWPRAARVGAVLTGPARGTVAIIGTAIIGIMGIIIMAMMWSSSAALAFRGGGAGGLRGAGTTAIHIAIILMAMVAPTATVTAAMVMATGIIMATATDTAPSISLTTETAADPESPSCNGGCHALVITMDPSTESWGRKRGAQSGLTSKTTITQVNRGPSSQAFTVTPKFYYLSVDWPAVLAGREGNEPPAIFCHVR